MKKLTVTMLIAVSIFMASVPAFADDVAFDAFDATMDILLVRPASLAATVVGAAVFIVSLPFSIPSQSVGTTAQILVAEPFNYTFTRPIAEFSRDRTRGTAPSMAPQSPDMEKSIESDASSDK